MAKYPEGTVSPSGKHIVRGGRWVANEANSPPRTKTGAPEKPGPGDPAFYGDPNSIEAMRQAGEFRGTAAAAGPSAQILGSAMIPGALGAAAGTIPGTIGAIARSAIAHPRVSGAVAMGAPELARGNVGGALWSGTIGALLGSRLATTSGTAPAAVNAPGTIGSMISASIPAVAAPVASTAVKASAPAASAAAAKVLNTIQREFAKAVSKDLPKGSKIHLLLDESGIPVKVLTPGQASRVAEDLKTWLVKTW